MPPLVRAPGQRSLISGSASKEVARIGVVLLDPGRDREHVRVEDHVLGREADLLGQQVVRAPADRDAPLDVGRLPLLVERHHDDAGAVVADATRLLEEARLALLQADRVDDPLALDALQARLEHRPARAVDHDRQPCHLGLGRDHVQERPDRLLAVEQVGVHVDVEDVGAAAHLLERDLDGAREVVGLDETRGSARSRSRSCARRSGRSPCRGRSRTARARSSAVAEHVVTTRHLGSGAVPARARRRRSRACARASSRSSSPRR